MNRCLGFAVVILGALFAAPVQATTGFEAHGAYARFAMHDLNDSLSALNRDVGTSLGPIHSGPSYGFGLRQWSNPNVLLRFEFEKLEATTDDAGVRFSASGYVFSIGGTYFRPSRGPLRLGYGISLGQYHAFGEISSPRARLETRGIGYGVSLSGEGMMPLKNGRSTSMILGYRIAEIGHVKFADEASDLTIQYSGPFARISVAIDGKP